MDFKPENNIKKEPFFKEIIKLTLICLVVVLVIRWTLVQPFIVQGGSMEPNFSHKDYLIVQEIGYSVTYPKICSHILCLERKSLPFRKVERGEVIVFRFPFSDEYYIKRVIGLPEEKIRIDQGRVFIYSKEIPLGFEFKESYIDSSRKSYGDFEILLKENEYFVLGDNRKRSYDSRIWGPVSKDNIVGTVWLRLWPLSKIRWF